MGMIGLGTTFSLIPIIRVMLAILGESLPVRRACISGY